MNAGSERIRVSVDGEIAYVTLNRPDKHNGMDFAMLRAMVRAQKQLKRRRDIRAVILQGAGSSFCAGLDFKSALARPLETLLMGLQLWWPWRNNFQRWSVGWRDLGVPVIALIHGNCYGAGMQLALGADIRISTPDARYSLMETKWGLIPDMGGTPLLRDLVPLDVAKELVMTGRVIDAAEAHAFGLVTHLSNDPLTHARQLVAEIATRSPDAVAAGKLLLQRAYAVADGAALRAERRWQRRLIGRANQRAAIARNSRPDAPDGKSIKPWGKRRIG
ncbi:MAG: crotonase/enoyl-CoA hydratase family protein [Sterolibacterium sp.]|jgi:enoyl-CoA hydratase/carnithine racemase|nr:crotonase/enoyl-CoA hydratase family protein [Sterolibacterium sp.]